MIDTTFWPADPLVDVASVVALIGVAVLWLSMSARAILDPRNRRKGPS